MPQEQIASPLNIHGAGASALLDLYRVLLIEDNRGDAYLIQRSLEETFDGEYDFKFVNVQRLGDALRLSETRSFDLVLMDLNLSDSNGANTVSAIYNAMPNIPIIVYSGMDDATLKQKALMCGAKAYLVKGHGNQFALESVIRKSLNLL